MEVEIDAKDYGSEIWWVTDPPSTASGGPHKYADDQNHVESHCLPEGANYTFVASGLAGHGRYAVHSCGASRPGSSSIHGIAHFLCRVTLAYAASVGVRPTASLIDESVHPAGSASK